MSEKVSEASDANAVKSVTLFGEYYKGGMVIALDHVDAQCLALLLGERRSSFLRMKISLAVDNPTPHPASGSGKE